MRIADCGLRNKTFKLIESRVRDLNSELPACPAGRRTPNSKLQRGFTLIEIIIVIVILAVVSGITIKFLTDSLGVYTMTVNQKNLFDEGKLALERMCRDIRDARSITTPLAGASGSLIAFTRNNATAQDVAAENITFQLTGTTLEKVKASPVVTISLSSNVSTFTVTRGAGANTEITLLLNLLLGTGENVILQTKVYPKNLAEDLTSTYKNFRIQDSGGTFASWQEVRSP